MNICQSLYALFVLLSLFSSISYSGIDSNMFVETIEGRRKVALLKVGSELICRDKNNQRVSSKIRKFDGHEVDKFLKIIFYGGEEIETLPDQRVFVEGCNYYDEKSNSIKMRKINKWMAIGNLMPGHVLASSRVIRDFMFEGSQSNEILAIEKKYERKIFMQRRWWLQQR